MRFRLAAGTAIAAFGLPVLTGITGLALAPAVAQDASVWATETPAERCARQTAEWNTTQEQLWLAAHPGQTPGPNAWPPYVCVDVPTPEAPVPAVPPIGGGSVTIGNPPGREHQWDIRDDEPSEYRQDMELGSAQDHRGSTPSTVTPGTRAGDSARSNMPLPSGWATTVTGADGTSQEVRVVDTDDGAVVVDEDGRATGDVLVTDPATGESHLESRDGLAGREVGAPENDGDAESSGSADGSASEGSDDVQAAGDVDPAVPVGVAGALAGAFVATRGTRGSRHNRAGRAGDDLRDAGERLGLPGMDAAPRVTINHLTGAEQTIFTLLSPESDHTQEFDLDVPEGGRAEIRADGGVDIVNADGTLVRQVAPPWAYDALGRPQRTWFTIDPETGNLVQHVDPMAGALYPIIADPKKTEEELDRTKPQRDPNFIGPVSPEDAAGQRRNEQRMDNNLQAAAANGNHDPAELRPQYEATRTHDRAVAEQEQRDSEARAAGATGNGDSSEAATMVGLVDTTGFHEGDVWNEPMDNGSTAQHQMVTGMGGLAVRSRITRSDGTVVEFYTVADEDNGFQSWGENPDGGATYTAGDGQGAIDSQNWGPGEDVHGPARVTAHSEDGGETWTQVGRNRDGTISTGASRQVNPNQWILEVENPDGSESSVLSTAQNETGDISTMVSDDNGVRVGNGRGTITPIDNAGNDISNGKIPRATTGRFYDPSTGYWHNGVIDQETGARTFRLDDGRYLIESPSISGPSSWQVTGDNGEIYAVTDLAWDPETGEPEVRSQSDSPVGVFIDPETGEAIENWESSLGPLNAAGAIVDGQASVVDELADPHVAHGNIVQGMREGAADGFRGMAKPIPGLGWIVTGASIVSDVQSGASVSQAVTSEVAGMAAGAVVGGIVIGGVGAVVAAPAIPIAAGIIAGAAAGALVTNWVSGLF